MFLCVEGFQLHQQMENVVSVFCESGNAFVSGFFVLWAPWSVEVGETSVYIPLFYRCPGCRDCDESNYCHFSFPCYGMCSSFVQVSGDQTELKDPRFLVALELARERMIENGASAAFAISGVSIVAVDLLFRS